jgi:hypothetical protein
MPLVWMSSALIPRAFAAAISLSIAAALARIASTAVGAVVVTPAPTVAWSGRERTSSLTLKLRIGPCVVAAVTVEPPCCATAGAAAIRARPDAIAASICFVISFSCEPGFRFIMISAP